MRRHRLPILAVMALTLAGPVMAQQTDIVTRDVILKVPVKVEGDITAIDMGIEVQCSLDYDDNDPDTLDQKRLGQSQMVSMDAIQVALQPGALFAPTQADGSIELEFVFPVQYFVHAFDRDQDGLPAGLRWDLPNPWPVNATCRARPIDTRHGPRFETHPEVAVGSCDLSMTRFHFDASEEPTLASGCIER